MADDTITLSERTARVVAAAAATPIAVNPSMKPTKPGWKTTEFWGSVGALVMTNLMPSLPPVWQAVATAAITVGYQFSRSIAKRR